MDDDIRICSVCGKVMTEGFCIGDGESYYCSDVCLETEIDDIEYLKLFEAGSAYWTQWESA